ncbi:MAG: hypothetical protein WDN49_12040 [Acetobacteraceae bacterium]
MARPRLSFAAPDWRRRVAYVAAEPGCGWTRSARISPPRRATC